MAEEVVTKFGKIVYFVPGLSYALVNNAFEIEITNVPSIISLCLHSSTSLIVILYFVLAVDVGNCWVIKEICILYELRNKNHANK